MNADFFNNRKTVRVYDCSRAISGSTLNSMLEAAFRAPTTGNMQLYSVIATRTPERKKALAPAHFNQPQVTGCDTVLTFCADFNRFEKWCKVNNAVPGYNNFQSFMTAVLDTAIVAQQFCTIAESNGLGCCYLGTTTYNAPEIAQALHLPERVVPVTTLTVGYPAETPQQCDRLPADAIIHNEQYRDYTESMIHKIYAEKEAREDSAMYIAENNKQTLAQVFTDIRYPRSNNEHFSKVYLDFIRQQGF